MFGNLGTTELLIILLIILVFFGAKKIPDLASGLGKGIRSFKKSLNGDDEIRDKNDDNKELKC